MCMKGGEVDLAIDRRHPGGWTKTVQNGTSAHMHEARLITALLLATANPSLAAADIAVPGAATQIPDNLHLLVGKHVVVGRMPLCVPSTYTANLSYAGKLAFVLSFQENNAFDHLGANLNRVPPNLRAMMEDAQKAATIPVRRAIGGWQYQRAAAETPAQPYARNESRSTMRCTLAARA